MGTYTLRLIGLFGYVVVLLSLSSKTLAGPASCFKMRASSDVDGVMDPYSVTPVDSQNYCGILCRNDGNCQAAVYEVVQGASSCKMYSTTAEPITREYADGEEHIYIEKKPGCGPQIMSSGMADNSGDGDNSITTDGGESLILREESSGTMDGGKTPMPPVVPGGSGGGSSGGGGMDGTGYGPWSDWQACTCGTPTTRTRQCTAYGNKCSGDASQTQTCASGSHGGMSYGCPPPTTTQPPATWGPWTDWTPCSQTCGGGTQTRSRTCSRAGQCQGSATESKSCTPTLCPEWGPWADWSPCSQSCTAGYGKSTTTGGGTQGRTRTCSVPGKCPGPASDSQPCAATACPEWGPWADWSPCSQSCTAGYGSGGVTAGGGKQTRTRTCSIDGKCQGPASDSQICAATACPEWGPWADWSPCSQSCTQGYGAMVAAGGAGVAGGGTQSRTRTCSIAGKCTGAASDSKTCAATDCPSWGPWQDWGPCSKSCVGGAYGTAGASDTSPGQQSRSRTCSVPGKCTGPASDSQSCGSQACPTPAPVYGGWTAWSACSVTCGAGTQSRTRTCPGPGVCDGAASDSQQCQASPCKKGYYDPQMQAFYEARNAGGKK